MQTTTPAILFILKRSAGKGLKALRAHTHAHTQLVILPSVIFKQCGTQPCVNTHAYTQAQGVHAPKRAPRQNSVKRKLPHPSGPVIGTPCAVAISPLWNRGHADDHRSYSFYFKKKCGERLKARRAHTHTRNRLFYQAWLSNSVALNSM